MRALRTQFAVLAVVAFAAAATSAFAQTAVHPADWSAAANAASLQTSGKTLVFHVKDVSEAVRLTVLDLKGRPVWSRTATPMDGAVTLAWDGSAATSQAVRGVYVARAEAVGTGRKTLVEKSFVYAP